MSRVDWLVAAIPIVRWVARTFCKKAQDVDDLVGDVVVRALERLGTFRGNSLAEFKGWLRRIAHNSCVNAVRGKKRSREVLGCVDELVAANCDVEEAVIGPVEARVVKEATRAALVVMGIGIQDLLNG